MKLFKVECLFNSKDFFHVLRWSKELCPIFVGSILQFYMVDLGIKINKSGLSIGGPGGQLTLSQPGGGHIIPTIIKYNTTYPLDS